MLAPYVQLKIGNPHLAAHILTPSPTSTHEHAVATPAHESQNVDRCSSEMVTAVANASPDEWTELRSSCESCGLPFCVKRSSECASALCSDCEQSQETTSHSASDGESDGEFDPLSDLLTAGESLSASHGPDRCEKPSQCPLCPIVVCSYARALQAAVAADACLQRQGQQAPSHQPRPARGR